MPPFSPSGPSTPASASASARTGTSIGDMPRSGLETFTFTPSTSPSGSPSWPATATLMVFAPGANGCTSTPNAAAPVYSTAARPAYAGPAPSAAASAAAPLFWISPSGSVEFDSRATAPIRTMPTAASALRPGPIRPSRSNRRPPLRAAAAAAATRWWCTAMPTIARARANFAMMMRPYAEPATSPMSPSSIHMRRGPDTTTRPIETAATTVNLGMAASMSAPPAPPPPPRSAGSSANARYATPPIQAAATRLCR